MQLRQTLPTRGCSQARSARSTVVRAFHARKMTSNTSSAQTQPSSPCTPPPSMGGQQAGFWAALGAAALVCTTAWCPGVHAAYASPAGEAEVLEKMARYDENLMTKEVKEFVALLESKGSSVKAEELQAPRLKLGFRRGADGRLSLLSPDGHWYSVKADMQTPGFLLLRHEVNGEVWFLPPDVSGRLMQIDLSDDLVAAQLFGSGWWADVMRPVKVHGPDGGLEMLRMDAHEFRDLTTLLENAVEGGEELEVQAATA